MIRLLQRKEIDAFRWDECISSSPDGQAFFYSWYLDTCAEQWLALVEGEYEAVFPLACRSKFGIEYLYQPYFTRHSGLIARKGSDASQRRLFLDAIPSDYKYADFCLHSSHHEIPDDAKSEEKQYQELRLSDSYTDIHDRYHENLIRNLKKAERKNLSLRPDYNPDFVVDQFMVHQKEKREEFSDADFHVLKRLMKEAGRHTSTQCLAVQAPDGTVLAGAFLLRCRDRWLYLKGFSSPDGKKCGAMHFLFDRFIRSHAGQDLVLDFGGSSVKSVARFYQSYGSTDCVYLHLRINRLPKALRWLKR
ncbi:MAG: GNAT family N-acetyltransferase [Bacteroidia bacterium]|nr:GNAT family N-acetyltransferase [Bacteroidia bacterium]